MIVIGIISILSIVVILTLNPVELFRQSRDSNRLSDLNTINTAIGLYATDIGSSLGTASTTYVSVPDPAATSTAGTNCASLGLPALPSGYTYHCAASSTYRNTDGTGWIPVNFKSISSGSPLGALPADPVNTSSSRLYYTYTTNGSQYETTAAMESQKYKLGGTNDVISNDGGTLASVYEKGSKLGLEPLDYGDSSLVALWTFDEGTGTTVYDYSGNNATGSWNGTLGSQWTTGKVGGYAGNFDGSDNYLGLGSAIDFANASFAHGFTISVWVNPSATPSVKQAIFSSALNSAGDSWQLYTWYDTNNTFNASQRFSGSQNDFTSQAHSPGAWYLFTFTWDGTTSKIWVNGAQENSTTGGQPTNAPTGREVQVASFKNGGLGIKLFAGKIDDVRVYNRALSAAEILAMYNATK